MQAYTKWIQLNNLANNIIAVFVPYLLLLLPLALNGSAKKSSNSNASVYSNLSKIDLCDDSKKRTNLTSYIRSNYSDEKRRANACLENELKLLN